MAKIMYMGNEVQVIGYGAGGGGGSGEVSLDFQFDIQGQSGTDIDIPIITITANSSATVEFGSSMTSQTQTGADDGYAQIWKNGVSVYKKKTPTNIITALDNIPSISLIQGDVLTLSVGFDNYHTNCWFDFKNGEVTINGDAHISGNASLR